MKTHKKILTSYWLDPDIKEAIDTAAIDQDRTKTAIVERALRKELKKYLET